jgi:hypothetical protein
METFLTLSLVDSRTRDIEVGLQGIMNVRQTFTYWDHIGVLQVLDLPVDVGTRIYG